MERVALIYNPSSGQLNKRRTAIIKKVLAVLHAAGVEAEAIETSAPGSAGQQALDAAQRGCDTILACGGDGTVHEVLQTLVGTQVVLGVVPLGTANALAADLGLQVSPVRAAHRLLTAIPVRIPVGRVSYQDSFGQPASRFFTVAAGIGADGHFFSRLDASLKRRFGYLVYVVEALKLWATHSFPLFEASIQTSEGATPRIEQVSELLSIRISNFGGVIHNLLPGSALSNKRLSLLAFKTRSRLSYLRFIVAVVFGRQTFSQNIELVNAISVECRVLEGSKATVFIEADGEPLGTLPARIEILPDSITLLMPKAKA